MNKFINRISPAKRSNNLYKHIWIDDGLKENTEKFVYTCRKCGKKRIKCDSFSMEYYEADWNLIGSIAPECVLTCKPYLF